MQRSKEVTVDEMKYSMTQYSATKGWNIFKRLSKIIGKPVGALVGSGGMDAALTGELASKAIETLTEELNDVDVNFIKELLSTTVYVNENGERQDINVIFDTHFAGRFGHLFKLLKEIVMFQFSDFFGDLAALFGEVQPKVAKLKAK